MVIRDEQRQSTVPSCLGRIANREVHAIKPLETADCWCCIPNTIYDLMPQPEYRVLGCESCVSRREFNVVIFQS